MKKHRILRAVEENWGLIGPGSWESVTWVVYSDGSFTMQIQIRPESLQEIIASRNIVDVSKASMNTEIRKQSQTYSGVMDFASFQKLLSLLMVEQWRDPNIDSDACDGSAWTFSHYDPEGHLIKTTGKVEYIYGQPILEGLAKVLPLHEIY